MHTPEPRRNPQAKGRRTNPGEPMPKRRVQSEDQWAAIDLSGVYKKKAHLRSDVNRNLKAFYNAPKGNGSRPVHMGQVEDPLTKKRRMPKREEEVSARPAPNRNSAKESPEADGTRHFSIPTNPKKHPRADRQPRGTGQAQTREQTYAAFQNQQTGGTRMFTSPGVGGEAVKSRWRFIPDAILHLFTAVEEQWCQNVDQVKKQALLHKKLVDHRRGLMLALTILCIVGLCAGCIYDLIFVVRTVETAGDSPYSAYELVEASGIREDMHIFSFSEEDTAARLSTYCPYIRAVHLTRRLPSTVTLTVEQDQAVYCANVFGEIVALSPGLRVLGSLTEEEAADYILLRLPDVSEAVAGRQLVFAEERHGRYIRLVLDEVTSSAMAPRISYMDLRSEHDILLHCDGMYELQLGNSADLKMKLRMAENAIGDEDFPQNTPARINLSVVSEASIQAELRLELDVTP